MQLTLGWAVVMGATTAKKKKNTSLESQHDEEQPLLPGCKAMRAAESQRLPPDGNPKQRMSNGSSSQPEKMVDVPQGRIIVEIVVVLVVAHVRM